MIFSLPLLIIGASVLAVAVLGAVPLAFVPKERSVRFVKVMLIVVAGMGSLLTIAGTWGLDAASNLAGVVVGLVVFVIFMLGG